jgi:hypothetical protein
MVVNDNAYEQDKHGALDAIAASQLLQGMHVHRDVNQKKATCLGGFFAFGR